MDGTRGGRVDAGQRVRQWRRHSGVAVDRPRLVEVLVIFVCAAVLVQAFGLEPFQVPTGSMAPALFGHHRVCVCPCCGHHVTVGRTSTDKEGRGEARCYAKVTCPNCGTHPLPLSDPPETPGDQVLVNKAAYSFRRPRRWEVVVFRLFGLVFIKRIAGLPGEAVLLRDGDVFVDGRLARKTYSQARAMRLEIFDQECRPALGWRERWEWQPDFGSGQEAGLYLDARNGAQTLTHRTGPAIDGKCPPLRDEYGYSAGLRPGTETVHDFLIEADVEVLDGQGTLALRLCDGQDWAEVVLPAGQPGPVATNTWAADAPHVVTSLATRPGGVVMPVGRRCRVEMAFVDRRVSLLVDGRPLVQDVDLPEAGPRPAVDRPVQMEACGVAVAIRRFRLYRDIHYTQHGRQAVGAEPVRLGVEQYFVLGDNSPNSEDSRFWPAGAVTARQLLGPAFLLHLPSRPVVWQCAGRSLQGQVPDVGRIRWLK